MLEERIEQRPHAIKVDSARVDGDDLTVGIHYAGGGKHRSAECVRGFQLRVVVGGKRVPVVDQPRRSIFHLFPFAVGRVDERKRYATVVLVE